MGLTLRDLVEDQGRQIAILQAQMKDVLMAAYAVAQKQAEAADRLISLLERPAFVPSRKPVSYIPNDHAEWVSYMEKQGLPTDSGEIPLTVIGPSDEDMDHAER